MANQMEQSEQSLVVQYFTGGKPFTAEEYKTLAMVVGLDNSNLGEIVRHRLSPENRKRAMLLAC
jgi:hypothetical protein